MEKKYSSAFFCFPNFEITEEATWWYCLIPRSGALRFVYKFVCQILKQLLKQLDNRLSSFVGFNCTLMCLKEEVDHIFYICVSSTMETREMTVQTSSPVPLCRQFPLSSVLAKMQQIPFAFLRCMLAQRCHIKKNPCTSEKQNTKEQKKGIQIKIVLPAAVLT